MRQNCARPDRQLVASMRNAVKRYGPRTVVNDVSIDVFAGETTILVGPNGSGKTTTMEMMVGLRRFTSGSAEICGIRVKPNGAHRLYTGVQLQHAGFPSHIRVNEVLKAVAALYSHPADIHYLAEVLGLAEHWNTYVDNLSGGQRRRLDIAVACIGRPKFLVLDEPTSGIDPEGRAEVWRFLRQLARQGTAVLASTHDLGEAEAFADQVILMANGKVILRGTPQDLLSSMGGDWRLRIHDAPDFVYDMMLKEGLKVARVGATALVLGNRETLESLRTRLESDLQGKGISNVEILSGRIRLEDVFFIAKEGEHS